MDVSTVSKSESALGCGSEIDRDLFPGANKNGWFNGMVIQ